MWKYARKFFVFIGIFVLMTLLLSIVVGLLLTYLYPSGYGGNPIIGTLINVISAVVAVIIAYKPFKKMKKS
ncbi:hypothetical protein [Rossellomorea aquimaris]|uniref:hypothetical protein n=1 Tax=Rossellomorea aquimaris TaxID=189382 RepID=UPI0007D0B632|nr:hypothetical protein [Rossellomorea aquimaris]